MLSIQRGLVLLSTVGAAAASMLVHNPADVRVADTPTDPQAIYTKADVEYYLTEDQLQWIRPGLAVTVESVEISADLHPVVVLSFADDLGQPLDRAGVITPGAISFSYILSWYDAANRDYQAYTTRPQTSPITGVTEIQASSDSGGTTEDLGMGRLRYTFGTQLPADYDGSKTTTLGIYASRNLQELLEKTYYDNVEHDFRPDGGAVTDVWAAMDDATCNSCHEQLAFHGGSRRDVKLCVLCHNSGSVDPDTGNTVDFKVMIHKIHSGEELPSVQAGIPYQIIGFRQSVHDYSDVVFPQDTRNCVRCHAADSPEGHIWFSRPKRATCGSCHDNIVWETGEGHALPQFNDDACTACHQPEGDREFDISIKGAHTIPTQSSQLAGLNVEIISVEGAVPGGLPTVTFAITDDDGNPVDIATMNRVGFVVGGPTTDFAEYIRDNAIEAPMVGDLVVHTFTTPLPETATGTWAFFIDARREVELAAGPETITTREGAFNPVFYASVDGTGVEERRMVVDIDKCNVCHGELAFHGGQRKNPLECAVCHNANGDDGGEPVAESIHFKWMIHKIHSGEDLANGYAIGDAEFGDVRFPGDTRTCVTCHVTGSYGVPVVEGALDTATTRVGYYFPIKPAGAACLACHDSVDAAAHAYTNTAPFGEGCASCHGGEREFSVERVHAH